MGIYAGTSDIPSKEYRHTFSENAQSHVKQRGYCEFLPGVFNNPRLIDVTELYVRTNEITVPVLYKSGKNKFAYLSVSDRQNWVPVGWGTLKNGLANYLKVGENSVFLPVTASISGIQAFNYPFIVLENGEVRYFKPNFDKVRRVVLHRKHPLNSEIEKSIERMVHGKFQASDNENFENAETLYSINESPGPYYHELKINKSTHYRYVRYLGRDSSRCNISEIEFYESDNIKPLKGEIIGTQGSLPQANAFDGDVLTYFHTWQLENIWIGLDFGKPMKISKIRFAARNDKNHIIPGNLYELFYWDNEWKSLGTQVATDKILVYDSVPSNCLLFLKNHTEGQEERVFTYEDGKQVWR